MSKSEIAKSTFPILVTLVFVVAGSYYLAKPMDEDIAINVVGLERGTSQF